MNDVTVRHRVTKLALLKTRQNTHEYVCVYQTYSTVAVVHYVVLV